jgi:transposase
MDEGSYEARKSAPKDRVEITTRTERRRRWSAEEKLRIVRETLRPGAVAQVVADQHGISTGLLYTWRKQMLTAALKLELRQPDVGRSNPARGNRRAPRGAARACPS